MPLGDADIASGVFFADFGVSVVFGEQPAVKGNFDAPGEDSRFGENVSVSGQAYRVEVAAVAFTPFPGVDDVLTIDAGSTFPQWSGRYKIRSADPLDDGATVEIKLRKLN